MTYHHIEVHFYLEIEAATEDEAEEWGWAVQQITHPQTNERLGPDHVSVFERLEELSDAS